MKWFRWHRGSCSNPKFALIAQRASRSGDVGEGDRVRGAVAVTDVIAVWAVILEDAAKNEHWGTFTKDAAFIALVLRWYPEEVQQVLDEMCDEGMLDPSDGGLKVTKWEQYQYRSDLDSTAAERQRRRRNALVTDMSRVTHARVTRPDTDTESERKKELSCNRATNGHAERPPPNGGSPSDDGGFVRFWDCYQFKKGRGQAERAFRKAIKKTTLEVMLAAIERQKPQRKPGFVKHPATWLNGECWADEDNVIPIGPKRMESVL